MTKHALQTAIALILFCTTQLVAAEKPKLERGKDFIEVPAKGEGLCLANIFQSNMVLQRDKPVSIWGWASPGEDVTVTFAGQNAQTKAAADRSWKVTFAAMPASSEARSLTVKGNGKSLSLDNILVGDIWVLGGQSNMEFEITKVDNGDLEVVSANFPEIRLMSVPQLEGPESKVDFPRQYQWIDFFGEHYRQGYWDVCTPQIVREMSGIGYVFARRIHMASRVPIGVIDASKGGTCLETWTPIEVVKATDTPEVKATLAEWEKKISEFDPQTDLEARKKQYEGWAARMKSEGKPIPANRTVPSDLRRGPAADMNRPGNCYAGMIAPLSGLSVKGVIWHQGFNNALQLNGHVIYYQLFSKMIGSWRRAFNDPVLPFGIISLCTAGEPQTLDNYLESFVDEGIYIREVHHRTFLDLRKAGDKNIGYASSFDLRRSWYHPQIKIPAGERIARWALATQYGKNIRWLPPTVQEVTAKDGGLHLKLDSTASPYNDGPILGFAISGKDGRFQPAKAEYLMTGKDASNRPQYSRSILVLTSPLVPEPVHFRYAWGRNPLGNVASSDHTHLPLVPQRSDRWTMVDAFELFFGEKPSGGVLQNNEERKLRNALKSEDLKRRAAEAKTFLENLPKP